MLTFLETRNHNHVAGRVRDSGSKNSFTHFPLETQLLLKILLVNDSTIFHTLFLDSAATKIMLFEAPGGQLYRGTHACAACTHHTHPLWGWHQRGCYKQSLQYTEYNTLSQSTHCALTRGTMCFLITFLILKAQMSHVYVCSPINKLIRILVKFVRT